MNVFTFMWTNMIIRHFKWENLQGLLNKTEKKRNTDLTRWVKAPAGKNCDIKDLTDSAGLFLQF